MLQMQKSPNVLYEVDDHLKTIRVLGQNLKTIHIIQPFVLGRLQLGALNIVKIFSPN